MAWNRSSVSSSLIPRIEQFRRMFSRPENSGWKPAPSSRREAIRPRVMISPEVGWVMPVSSLSSVLFPAPFSPMIPTVEPCGMSRYTSRTAQNSFPRGPPGSTRSHSRWIGFSYIRYALLTPRATMTEPPMAFDPLWSALLLLVSYIAVLGGGAVSVPSGEGPSGEGLLRGGRRTWTVAG